MANYIEEYVVLGKLYGIEDFKSKGDHFFDGKDIDGKPRPRFMLWAGGCGICKGHHNLKEARNTITGYIHNDVARELLLARKRAKACEIILNKIHTTVLDQFKVAKGSK